MSIQLIGIKPYHFTAWFPLDICGNLVLSCQLSSSTMINRSRPFQSNCHKILCLIEADLFKEAITTLMCTGLWLYTWLSIVCWMWKCDMVFIGPMHYNKPNIVFFFNVVEKLMFVFHPATQFNTLRLRGWDKIANILQMTYSSSFSSMKICVLSEPMMD